MLQVRHYRTPGGLRATAPQESWEGLFERRAFAIVEEAATLGLLPPISVQKARALSL